MVATLPLVGESLCLFQQIRMHLYRLYENYEVWKYSKIFLKGKCILFTVCYEPPGTPGYSAQNLETPVCTKEIKDRKRRDDMGSSLYQQSGSDDTMESLILGFEAPEFPQGDSTGFARSREA